MHRVAIYQIGAVQEACKLPIITVLTHTI
jgi:hypothetical protein